MDHEGGKCPAASLILQQRLKSKRLQNRHGSHPSCASYKLSYLERTVGVSLTVFTLQQTVENGNYLVGSLFRIKNTGRTPKCSV